MTRACQNNVKGKVWMLVLVSFAISHYKLSTHIHKNLN